MIINDAEYYESNTATASDSQGDLTRNTEAVTHTRNGNESVTHTINGNYEQKLLSNRTIPVLSATMNPGIDKGIAPIIVALQMLLMPETKEVIADAALGGTWKNRTPQQVCGTGVKGSTPGEFLMMLVLLNIPTQYLLELLELLQPVAST